MSHPKHSANSSDSSDATGDGDSRSTNRVDGDAFRAELASTWGSRDAKPPAAVWSYEQTAGPQAQTAAGRAIERLSLSVLGQKIDDGYGKDGCMQSVSNHILRPFFESEGKSFPGFSDSHAFINWAKKHPELVSTQSIGQQELRAQDLQPGDVIIGNKSTGNHVMVVARLPASWGGSDQALAFLGNTGHPEWCPDGPNGPHFRVQEFIGTTADEQTFGTHHGGPESNSPSNPYNIRGATWTVIRAR